MRRATPPRITAPTARTDRRVDRAADAEHAVPDAHVARFGAGGVDLGEDGAGQRGGDGHEQVGELRDATVARVAEPQDGLRVGRVAEVRAGAGDGAEDFAGEAGVGGEVDRGRGQVGALREEDEFVGAVGVLEEDGVDGGAVVVGVWVGGSGVSEMGWLVWVGGVRDGGLLSPYTGCSGSSVMLTTWLMS